MNANQTSQANGGFASFSPCENKKVFRSWNDCSWSIAGHCYIERWDFRWVQPFSISYMLSVNLTPLPQIGYIKVWGWRFKNTPTAICKCARLINFTIPLLFLNFGYLYIYIYDKTMLWQYHYTVIVLDTMVLNI